jgi:hypothetical protein
VTQPESFRARACIFENVYHFTSWLSALLCSPSRVQKQPCVWGICPSCLTDNSALTCRQSRLLSLHPTSSPQPGQTVIAVTPIFFFFFFKIYLFIICKYTVAVFRHSRRGHQILLQMVVGHHVVAEIWTPDLRKSSRCSYPLSHFTSRWLQFLNLPVNLLWWWSSFHFLNRKTALFYWLTAEIVLSLKVLDPN